MTPGFQQDIAGYTVANLGCYPIRRRIAYASALESQFNVFMPNGTPPLYSFRWVHVHFLNIGDFWKTEYFV